MKPSLRFRRDRLVDRAACWLVDRSQDKLAIRLWRVFGLWCVCPDRCVVGTDLAEAPIDRVTFQWQRPTLIVYRAATPKPFQVLLNRYPGVVIGCAVQVRRRVWSLVWGRPGKAVAL